MTAKLLKDYLKTKIYCENWYVGKIDRNKEEAICLYANKRNIERISKFKILQTYSILPVTLLIRWSKNYEKVEKKASEIYELLEGSSFLINSKRCYIKALYESPIDLGTDDNNVFEQSIEFNLYYER